MDKEEKKSLEYLTPIIDGFKIMEKNAGWIWFKEKILKDRKKNLDILLGDDNIESDKINSDKVKGKILQADLIFSDIDIMKNKYKKLMEE